MVSLSSKSIMIQFFPVPCSVAKCNFIERGHECLITQKMPPNVVSGCVNQSSILTSDGDLVQLGKEGGTVRVPMAARVVVSPAVCYILESARLL